MVNIGEHLLGILSRFCNIYWETFYRTAASSLLCIIPTNPVVTQ